MGVFNFLWRTTCILKKCTLPLTVNGNGKMNDCVCVWEEESGMCLYMYVFDCQGQVLASFSGVLGVPGGPFSLLLPRSKDFKGWVDVEGGVVSSVNNQLLASIYYQPVSFKERIRNYDTEFYIIICEGRDQDEAAGRCSLLLLPPSTKNKVWDCWLKDTALPFWSPQPPIILKFFVLFFLFKRYIRNFAIHFHVRYFNT